ncbi:hypothetical protein QN277_016221 [Acacia crassicarpa]|uniref:Uncharacterized protein n=1 Tax=Acacia crassicarpa TaxID=499986 RepID=A0AAE1MW88_9FABA|nr:hypothetical protein QN277_016221 [Acacia crassicarpa]
MRDIKPDMVVLVEPRISGLSVDRFISRSGFGNSYRIEARRFTGGIWLLWQESLSVSVELCHMQFVHVRLTDRGTTDSFLFTVVYGSPNNTLRKEL